MFMNHFSKQYITLTKCHSVKLKISNEQPVSGDAEAVERLLYHLVTLDWLTMWTVETLLGNHLVQSLLTDVHVVSTVTAGCVFLIWICPWLIKLAITYMMNQLVVSSTRCKTNMKNSQRADNYLICISCNIRERKAQNRHIQEAGSRKS